MFMLEAALAWCTASREHLAGVVLYNYVYVPFSSLDHSVSKFIHTLLQCFCVNKMLPQYHYDHLSFILYHLCVHENDRFNY
jgi:hypothetical protein